MKNRFKTGITTRQKHPLRSLGTEIAGRAAKDAEEGRAVDWQSVAYWASLTDGLPISRIKSKTSHDESPTRH